MQEAPYSANLVMFNPAGLRMQVTIRGVGEDEHMRAIDSYIAKRVASGWRLEGGRSDNWSELPPAKPVLPEVDFGSNAGGTVKATETVAHRKPVVELASEAQLHTMHALGNALYAIPVVWDEKRPELVRFFSNKRVSSSTELSAVEVVVMIAALEKRVCEEYGKLSDAHLELSPFELAEIDKLHGVELAQAMRDLRKQVAILEAHKATV